MNSKKKYSWLFCLFFCILFYPLLGGMLDKYFTLSGVATQTEKPIMKAESLINGEYQENMTAYLLENIPGRNFMVKIHNQLLYSIFDVSANSNIVIGDDKQLFEPEYLEYSLSIWQQPTIENIASLVNKLTLLENALIEDGKQLYIFITPSKARYYAEDAPLAYKICDNRESQEVAYDTFVRCLDDSGLKVFDTISYIDEHQSEFEFPLYYSTGIHWSNAIGAEMAVAFNQYLCETSGYDLGQMEVIHTQTGEIVHPDADLYKILNLLVLPEENYYTQEFSVKEGKDKPNVFFRGGSFMGQSIAKLIRNNIFGKDMYFENNNYFIDRFSSGGTLSDFNAYNELDIASYLEQSDILVLEVNENKIFTMSWGFIDYLLDYYGFEEVAE